MDIPEAMVSLYQHSQESLLRCKEVELAMTGLEKQGATVAGGAYFPVVAGRKRQIGDHHNPPGAACTTSQASPSSATAGGMQRVAYSRSSSRENLTRPPPLPAPSLAGSSYPPTPMESSLLSGTSSLASHGHTHRRGGRGRSVSTSSSSGGGGGGRSQGGGGEAVIRSVRVNGTCRAEQVCTDAMQ